MEDTMKPSETLEKLVRKNNEEKEEREVISVGYVAPLKRHLSI